MLTSTGFSVRLSDERHKYSDAIAEWLDYHTDYEDDSTGNVESPIGFVQRFGRTLLITDDRGFVDRDTWPTENEARRAFSMARDEYEAWEEGDNAQ